MGGMWDQRQEDSRRRHLKSPSWLAAGGQSAAGSRAQAELGIKGKAPIFKEENVSQTQGRA